jgi:hypothetical protein
MVATECHVLSGDILARCFERAPIYDRENRFWDDDFEELREAGYLLMAVPKELGGLGMSLAQVCREQRRLAYYAHATALAANMHLYWTGVAADLWPVDDKSLEWLLEVFAAGHAETGNDLPALFSTTKAERVDGGYRFTGRKAFGSLTPVWTRLGLHGMDTSDPAAPKIVHAFVPRGAKSATITETWDVLGMRATPSDDTCLKGRLYQIDTSPVWCRLARLGSSTSCSRSLPGECWGSPRFTTAWPNALLTRPSRTSKRKPRWPGRALWPIMQKCHTPSLKWPSSWSRSALTWRKLRRIGLTASIMAQRGAPRSSPPSTGRSRAGGVLSISPWT